MSKTLLQITQDILSDMNGDDVNSIFDTEEAEQVARHVIAVFDNIVAKETWNSMRSGIRLTSLADSTKPTHMTLPTNVKELSFIKYDKRKVGETRKQYLDVEYYDPDDFLRKINMRDSTAANVTVVTDTSGVELLILNDKAPEFYTSFDDETVIFDAHDSAVDSVLQTSKTQGVAYLLPTLALDDDAVPDLPDDTFRYFIEEATARAQWKQREFQDAISVNEANRQRRTLSRKAWRVNKPTRYPNYGRNSRGRSIHHTRDVTFKDNY